mmetsp:Transcript_21131/g.72750  ORF Transcript_21131/g.72750 Transcript_21131/m.72750 type:complete len:268 (+) Transcript_21131:120-923(+)
MHLAAVLDSHWSRRNVRPSPATAGIGLSGGIGGGGAGAARGRDLSNLDLWQGKSHVWCLLGFVVGLAVLCIGLFEATRLTTHVLRSPCTIIGSEVIDVGTCTLCDYGDTPTCEAHPIATARVAVTFKPLHSEDNVTGWVWYCKGHASTDPCQRQIRYPDQLNLGIQAHGQSAAPRGPVPCTVGEVFTYMQMHATEGDERQCYYSSRDPEGQEVWLTMPSPGLVDHAWFEKHVEYPVLLALGGMVLLSVLLGCLALEGAELWASGLVA